MIKRALTEKEAVEYIGLSASSLRQGRMKYLKGLKTNTPVYVKLGRCIRYLREDLDKFLEESRVRVIRKKNIKLRYKPKRVEINRP